MDFKHLTPLLPSFADELDKEAGIKEDLLAGTKKVITAVKDAPKKVNEAALKATMKLHSSHPLGAKLVTEGPDILRRLVT